MEIPYKTQNIQQMWYVDENNGIEQQAVNQDCKITGWKKPSPGPLTHSFQ